LSTIVTNVKTTKYPYSHIVKAGFMLDTLDQKARTHARTDNTRFFWGEYFCFPNKLST